MKRTVERRERLLVRGVSQQVVVLGRERDKLPFFQVVSLQEPHNTLATMVTSYRVRTGLHSVKQLLEVLV